MKRSTVPLLVWVVFSLFSANGEDAAPKTTPTPPPITKFGGTIKSIDPVQKILTMTGRKGDIRTYKLTESTNLKINGAKADLAAIPIGAYCRGLAKPGTDRSEALTLNILQKSKKDDTGKLAQIDTSKVEPQKESKAEPTSEKPAAAATEAAPDPATDDEADD